jgi:hypothetical protein
VIEKAYALDWEHAEPFNLVWLFPLLSEVADPQAYTLFQRVFNLHMDRFPDAYKNSSHKGPIMAWEQLAKLAIASVNDAQKARELLELRLAFVDANFDGKFYSSWDRARRSATLPLQIGPQPAPKTTEEADERILTFGEEPEKLDELLYTDHKRGSDSDDSDDFDELLEFEEK